MEVSIHPALAGHLGEAVRLLRRRLRKRLERVRRDPDPERVHQLRVETRRALALVDLVRAAGLTRKTRKLRKALKRQLDAFDEVRDLHICRQRLREVANAPGEVEPLATLWAKREEKMARSVARRLSGLSLKEGEKRLKKLEKVLGRAARAEGEEPVRGAVVGVLEPLFAEVQRRSRLVRTPAGVHRLRVAFKKYRYACEMLRPFLPGLSDAVLAAMREFHGLMGDLQDHAVLRGAVRRDAAKAGLPGTVHRALLRKLQERQVEILQRCQAAVRQLASWRPSGLARPRSR